MKTAASTYVVYYMQQYKDISMYVLTIVSTQHEYGPLLWYVFVI